MKLNPQDKNSRIIGWTIYQSQPTYHGGSGYAHLHIMLRAKGYLTFSGIGDISFRWQTDRDQFDKPDPWYGFGIVTEARNFSEHERGVKLIARIAKGVIEATPQEIIERLEKLKAPRLVHDPREGEVIEVKDVLPVDYKRWFDDYSAYGYTHNYTSVMARDELEAKNKMTKAMVEGEFPASTERLQAWVKAGLPVKKMDTYTMFDEAPDIKPLEDLLRSPFSVKEEPVGVA